MKRVFRGLLLLGLGICLSYLFVRFVTLLLPGTLADLLSDSETNLQDLEELSQQFKSQRSFVQTFLDFFSLNWGESILYAEASFSVIIRHFRLTALLSLLSLFFTLLFSMLFFCLPRRFSFSATNLLLTLPAVAVYPALVFLMCSGTSFCPAGSLRLIEVLLVAACAQGFLASPRLFRELEWEIDEIRKMRFVLVLRAKGLSRKRIWMWHVLRNAIAPVFSLLVLTTLGFFSGAILVEALFDLPGLGLLLLEAIRSRDLALLFPLVMFLSLLHLLTLQSGRVLKRKGASSV